LGHKYSQNSVSLHFGTPESDKHIFNGELVLHENFHLPAYSACPDVNSAAVSEISEI